MQVLQELFETGVCPLVENMANRPQVEKESLVLSLFHQHDHLLLVPNGGSHSQFEKDIAIPTADVRDYHVGGLNLMPNLGMNNA
jgi:hypothetical protein